MMNKKFSTVLSLIVAVLVILINQPLYAVDYLGNIDHTVHETTSCSINGRTVEIPMGNDAFIDDRRLMIHVGIIVESIQVYKSGRLNTTLIKIINMLAQFGAYAGDLTLDYDENKHVLDKYTAELGEYSHVINATIKEYYCNNTSYF